jgi:hypothetical protein
MKTVFIRAITQNFLSGTVDIQYILLVTHGKKQIKVPQLTVLQFSEVANQTNSLYNVMVSLAEKLEIAVEEIGLIVELPSEDLNLYKNPGALPPSPINR